MSNSPIMVAAEDLKKHYGHVHAVDGISFSVTEGEVFGFLGHNGAGKTTTIKIFTGSSLPSGGRAWVGGHDVSDRERVLPLINLVFEEQNLYERLSGRDNLRLFADLYRVSRTRVDQLLELVGLVEAARRKVKHYSNGMKQRLLIARALINAPRVLFLDEPTRGLDPTSAREIRTLVTRLSRQGTTVFLTTHYMEEADQLCQRVAFLSQGKIVALDTPLNLKLRYGTRATTVLLDNREQKTVALDKPEQAAQLEQWIREGRILAIHSQEASLEDVFIALAGRPL